MFNIKKLFRKKCRHKLSVGFPPRMVETACHGMVEVLDDEWYNILNYNMVYGWDFPSGFCIGIVKIRNEFGTEKSYIGIGKGKDYTSDIKLVLDCGVPFYYKGGNK